MSIESVLSSGMLSPNQIVIIGLDGEPRLAEKETLLAPGELVITSEEDLTTLLIEANISVVNAESKMVNIDDEIVDVLDALVNGQDPMQLQGEFATAAGSVTSSSIGVATTVERVGVESVAQSIPFETQGLDGITVSGAQLTGLQNVLFSGN